MRDIDQIERTLVELYPALKVSQLKVVHPGADDDGVWFFTHPASRSEVQLEATTGNCPFVLESDSDNQRLVLTTVEAVVEGVAAKLGLALARQASDPGR
ncbi:hypothetical protein [Lysobacter auxotrophicus]|uniref:Uncharacterized protein n=1 Tax=Lysobacter auxotrophicus TaxID=2992573 RepID=A0ABN6UV89_9GAMM|nr:hypothetical protein [Lysobacter auxotrophicus]BDU18133.1 hypothetical protein LA521A_33340 [Lysobacter auxotrophicus]